VAVWDRGEKKSRDEMRCDVKREMRRCKEKE
jgi:hypothetical protein